MRQNSLAAREFRIISLQRKTRAFGARAATMSKAVGLPYSTPSIGGLAVQAGDAAFGRRVRGRGSATRAMQRIDDEHMGRRRAALGQRVQQRGGVTL